MTKRLRPAELPGWPRLLPAPLAAAYLGVCPTKFRLGVKAGRYPKALADGGNTLWDRQALDAFVDSRASQAPGSDAKAPGDGQRGDRILEIIRGGGRAA